MLTDDQLERARAFFKKKSIGPCPMCNYGGEWEAIDVIDLCHVTVRTRSWFEAARTYPMLLMGCPHCAHVVMYSARAVFDKQAEYWGPWAQDELHLVTEEDWKSIEQTGKYQGSKEKAQALLAARKEQP